MGAIEQDEMARTPQSPPQNDSLRLLLVEDNENDAELILRAVGNAGFQPVCCRVQTADDCRAALASEPWELIISDYSLPQFNAMSALRCLHERELDLPFIVVSGTIDEESAITILKAASPVWLIAWTSCTMNSGLGSVSCVSGLNGSGT